ncbi:ketoacyl-ACP synthase III family protein [Streptomyces sp. HNM0574]|uniref:ketoacyl-ACP synthase III family protein n=1 Tax=Streptomyces sp. HNM0574 TaxID=2714954 RepID=UPI00146D4F72|nr:ketoacyl-ACP synthase III family protein [Streptomyces sp. HNM0574]NLU68777.1 3-oxoacyl-ACP synthase [Streptomyces sp. HNM0574]
MRPDNIHVSGLGTYLPERMSSRRAIELGLYDETLMLDSGVTGTLVAGETPPVEMAVSAARDALKRAGTDAGSLDLLIHSHVLRQGPAMWYPGGYILRELGGGDIPVFEVGQGCNGMLAALELAAGQLAADPARRTALLTTADNFASPHGNRWRGYGPGTVIGDAASAMTLTTDDGIARVRSVNQQAVPELEGLHRGREPLFDPHGRDEIDAIDMLARARDFSREHRPLAAINELIAEKQAEVARRSLEEAGIGPGDVARAIYVNQGRYLVGQFFLDPLGLPESTSTWDFGRTVGHLGASDHVVALDHLVTTGQLAAGDHVLLAGSAPGFVVSSAVLTMTATASWAL